MKLECYALKVCEKSTNYRSSAYIEDIADIVTTLERYPVAIETLAEHGLMSEFKNKIGALPAHPSDTVPVGHNDEYRAETTR